MNKFITLNWTEKFYKPIWYSVITGAGLLYIILDPLYRTGYLNDDALYVIRAREFANNFPFRSLLVRPDYPLPGLPLLLAPLVKLAGPHWTSLERLSIFATLLSVYLLWKWTSRWLPKGEALAITTLFAFNPMVARFSGIIMPEPYCALAAIASFSLLSDLLKMPTRKKAVALGFVAGWGSLLRPEAMLIVAGILPALLLDRQGRRALRIAIIPIGLWLYVYLSISHRLGSLQTEYGGDLAALKSYWAHSFLAGIGFVGPLLQVFLVRVLTGLRMSVAPGWVMATTLLIVFYLGAMGIGFRRLWKERPSQRALYLGIGLFCGLYFAVHVFWHVTEKRYALPLLPFMLIFLVHGVNALVSPLKKSKMWAALAFGVLLIPSINRNGRAVYEVIVDPSPMKSPPWESLAWLNQHTPPDVQVLSDIATNVELYTDRQAVVTVEASNSETFLDHLIKERLDYIVYRQLVFVTPGVGATDNPNYVWNRVSEWIIPHSDRFPMAFANNAEKTAVFHVTPESGFSEAYEKIKEATKNYQAGRFNDAFRLVKQCIGIDPKLGLAFNLLGAIYLRQNDLANAERAWLRSAELLPDSPNAMVNLATLYRMIGRTESVSVYLRRAKGVADRNGLAALFQRNIESRQREWDHHHAMLFIDPL